DWVTARALEVRSMDPAARRAFLPVARAHFPAVVREKLTEARRVLDRMREIATGADARFVAEVASRLDAVDARWTAYDRASRELFDALERPGADVEDPALVERAEAVRRLEKGLSVDVKLLQAALEGQVGARFHAAEREERKSALLVVLYAALAAMVGVLAMLVGQRLLAPIRTLTEGVKAVAAGDLSRKVEVHGSDELGLLAREFNAMAASLDLQRAELLRAERLAAVGRISAQITHEIRNPLNAIGLNAELLGEELSEAGAPAEAVALVQAIGREVDRLNAVTEEYLRFARLPRPALAREDVNELLSGLLEFVRPELAAARVRLEASLAPGLPLVRADEGQLRAAFLNLLRNSREAMPGGGVVSVATRALAAGGIEIEVSDTGPGIPPDAMPRIFDAFWSTKDKGTGLGLAFTQQVVKEHGGTITCRSAPGRGTAFTVVLPAAGDERTAPASPERAEAVSA
ncbi:MAG TPA: ATP-binding protein, partial [Myxococcales bacterium]